MTITDIFAFHEGNDVEIGCLPQAEFDEDFRNTPIKVVLHVLREADDVYIAEVQDYPTDVVIRIRVLVTAAAAAAVTRRPSEGGNGPQYFYRRLLDLRDPDNAKQCQVRFDGSPVTFFP